MDTLPTSRSYKVAAVVVVAIMALVALVALFMGAT